MAFSPTIVTSPFQTNRSKSFNLLRSERSKALSCFERALFYADTVPQLNGLSNLYELPTSTDQFVRNITAAYLEAGFVLLNRRTNISELYCEARDGLQHELVSDREKKAVLASSAYVWHKFEDIIVEANSRTVNASLDDLCDNWQGMDNICRLFMDEITHLSERLDEFNSTSKTTTSIRYAVLAIAIGVAFSLASLVISLTGRKPGIGSDFFTEVGTLKAKMVALHQAMSPNVVTSRPSRETTPPSRNAGGQQTGAHQ